MMVFSAYAADSATVQFEKEFFGEHYITDSEAYDFAKEGYPGVGLSEYIDLRSWFYVAVPLSFCQTEDFTARLAEYLPMTECREVVNYGEIGCRTDEGYGSGYIIKFDFSSIPAGYPKTNLDREVFNTKILYVLSQLNREILIENLGDEKMQESSNIFTVGIYITTDTAPINYILWRGDANNDKKNDAMDVLAIKRFAAGVDNAKISFCGADADENGSVSANDILTIKRYSAGITKYPYNQRVITDDNGNIISFNPIDGNHI